MSLRESILAAPRAKYRELAKRLGCSASYVLLTRWKHRRGDFERQEVARAQRAAARAAAPVPPPPPGSRTGRPWTRAESALLEELWGDQEASEIARLLGRSVGGLYQRAGVIGLFRGVPDGFESFNAACKRAGYDARTLLRILRWARDHGVIPPWRSPARRPLGSKPRATADLKGRHKAVDPREVNAAVAAWTDAETREQAAARLRCAHDTLGAALDAAGLLPKRRRGQGRKLKLPPEAFDRALLAWRARGVRIGVLNVDVEVHNQRREAA